MRQWNASMTRFLCFKNVCITIVTGFEWQTNQNHWFNFPSKYSKREEIIVIHVNVYQADVHSVHQAPRYSWCNWMYVRIFNSHVIRPIVLYRYNSVYYFTWYFDKTSINFSLTYVSLAITSNRRKSIRKTAIQNVNVKIINLKLLKSFEHCYGLWLFYEFIIQ